MGKLDNRYKEMIRLYLKEYFQLFFPDLASRMRFKSAVFLDKEFEDLFGKKDIKGFADKLLMLEIEIADSKNTGQTEIILIHWEQQDTRQKEFAERMFHYFCGIYYRHKKLVLPVVLFTDNVKWRKPVENRFQMSLLDYPIVDYRFQLIKLKSFSAEEFAQKDPDNPLVWTFLPMTDYKKQERPRMMARAVLGVIRTEKDEIKQATLLSLMKNSVKLNAEEILAFEEIKGKEEEFQEIKMLRSIHDWGFEDGFDEGQTMGKLKTTIDIITGLQKLSVDWDIIKKATGVSQKKFQKIQKEYERLKHKGYTLLTS